MRLSQVLRLSLLSLGIWTEGWGDKIWLLAPLVSGTCSISVLWLCAGSEIKASEGRIPSAGWSSGVADWYENADGSWWHRPAAPLLAGIACELLQLQLLLAGREQEKAGPGQSQANICLFSSPLLPQKAPFPCLSILLWSTPQINFLCVFKYPY